MIKAVFFDIDGTLLSFRTHEMPPSTLAAMPRAARAARRGADCAFAR